MKNTFRRTCPKFGHSVIVVGHIIQCEEFDLCPHSQFGKNQRGSTK